jgi:hypothetical protein
MVQVNQREVANAPVALTAPAVVPPKQAVLGAGATTRIQPPAALQSRAVVAKATPPPAPLPFAQRQAAIQANQGRPISVTQSRQMEVQQPARANVAPVRVAPQAKTVTNLQPGNKVVQPGNNRPSGGNMNAPTTLNKPATTNTNPSSFNDRPPTSRPTSNPDLEQKHQDQIQQLQQKQDQEYQKVQQKQYQEQQKLAQQNAAAEKQKQAQEKQEQQLQQMEEKHNQEQQKLQQKQTAEHAQAAKQSKPPKEDKPKNEEKPPHH